MGRLGGPRHGLARVLSKRGLCSRAQASQWISEGRVAVDGRIVRDVESPTDPHAAGLTIDGRAADAAAPLHVMLNKPRGLVTTAADEQGRDTVYRCLDGIGPAWIAPVGRLDKASEGLLLFSNDPQWASGITDPASGPSKTYHVQVSGLPDMAQLQARFSAGIAQGGDMLRASDLCLLRHGEKNAWLQVVLDEGRNRQIRRMLQACGIDVLRLVRVAIGPLSLGDLGKGQWRALTPAEVALLAVAPG